MPSPDATSPAAAPASSALGFTGTLRELFDWLADVLEAGRVEISKPWTVGYSLPKVTVRTSARPNSADQALLARVHEIPEVFEHWRSAYAGGLRVYQFPAAALENTTVTLSPIDEHPALELGQIRKVRVVSPRGMHTEVLEGYDRGVRITASASSNELLLEPATTERETS